MLIRRIFCPRCLNDLMVFREKKREKKTLSRIQQSTCDVSMTIWTDFVGTSKEQSMEINGKMCRKLKINKHNAQVQNCAECPRLFRMNVTNSKHYGWFKSFICHSLERTPKWQWQYQRPKSTQSEHSIHFPSMTPFVSHLYAFRSMVFWFIYFSLAPKILLHLAFHILN